MKMKMVQFNYLGLALVLLIGCNATPNIVEPTDGEPGNQRFRTLQISCVSDDDCGSEEYCNRGLCRPGGYCENTLDCKNPSNLYSMIECLGYLYCSSNNECEVQCYGSHCENRDEVDCSGSPPCETTECSEDYVSCVSDNCGGCNAYFFTATGEQACTIERSSVEPNCISDADCSADSMYCLNGECAEFGQCEDTIDCLNPSNAYTETGCIGYTICVSGTCEKTCSEDECPSEDEVQCYAPPCEVTTCTEEAVSCVDNTCGECKAIFFNAAGERVCEDTLPNGGCGEVEECEQTDSWELSMCRAKVFIRTMTCRLLRN